MEAIQEGNREYAYTIFIILRMLMSDNVNHPKHYTSHPSGIECIEVTEHFNFCIGNAIKYLWRNGLKDGNSNIQDLKKAIWYITREIETLENSVWMPLDMTVKTR